MSSMPEEGMSYNPIKHLNRMYKFVFYDIPGILYDHEPDGNAYLSLPRLMYGAFGLMVVVAYCRGELAGTDLMGVFGIAAGGYASKRIFPVMAQKMKAMMEESEEKEKEKEDEYDGE